jgi:alpha-glucosidase
MSRKSATWPDDCIPGCNWASARSHPRRIPIVTDAGDREPWWHGAVIYQIYPRSYADSNGDGIGDLAGIESRLDHIRGTDASLGADAIWLSPIYPSPLHDFGYDVADYTDVAPEFGTLADFDRLVEACHARGLRLLLDLVPCHTSIEHPWFVESRSSRSNPKRDWYIWSDPAVGGGPPNNWTSAFGGPSWEWDDATGQYYLHSFYPEQPNLNWRNAGVASAIHDAMRFWFERGVDGFRVDAIQAAIVDDQLRDNPPYKRPSFIPGIGGRGDQELLWNVDRPETLEVVRGLRRVAEAYPGRVLIGEVYAPVERMSRYLGLAADDAFHLAWNFEPLLTPWDARELALAIERAEALHPLHAWPTYALSNHDNPRHATRYGRERARLAALILLTLRGVPTLYAGEEIGMVDAPSLPAGLRFDRAGRDAQRTPMQWEPTPLGGFTSGTPWLPLVDPQEANVADQAADPSSLLSLYRRLIALRVESPAMRSGEHRSIFGLAPDVLAWRRWAGDEQLLVLANMADDSRSVDASQLGEAATVVVATGAHEGRVQLGAVELDGLEGLVLRL